MMARRSISASGMTSDDGAAGAFEPDGRGGRVMIDGAGGDAATSVVASRSSGSMAVRSASSSFRTTVRSMVWNNWRTLPGHDAAVRRRSAGSSIVRFAPDGKVERVIELPVSQPTSCCFAGPDLATLFVTSARHGLDAAALARNPAEGAVLAIETDVRGTPSIRFAG